MTTQILISEADFLFEFEELSDPKTTVTRLVQDIFGKDAEYVDEYKDDDDHLCLRVTGVPPFKIALYTLQFIDSLIKNVYDGGMDLAMEDCSIEELPLELFDEKFDHVFKIHIENFR